MPLTNVSNRIGSTYRCSNKFKLANAIKLIGCSNLIGIKTTTVLIENSPSFVANIKSFYS